MKAFPSEVFHKRGASLRHKVTSLLKCILVKMENKLLILITSLKFTRISVIGFQM